MGGGGPEEEEEDEGVEDEEPGAEEGYLDSDGVDLSLLRRRSPVDEVRLFQPLLQEEFVGWTVGYLVEWVDLLAIHFFILTGKVLQVLLF